MKLHLAEFKTHREELDKIAENLTREVVLDNLNKEIKDGVFIRFVVGPIHPERFYKFHKKYNKEKGEVKLYQTPAELEPPIEELKIYAVKITHPTEQDVSFDLIEISKLGLKYEL
jgi:hypothetical protein